MIAELSERPWRYARSWLFLSKLTVVVVVIVIIIVIDTNIH